MRQLPGQRAAGRQCQHRPCASEMNRMALMVRASLPESLAIFKPRNWPPLLWRITVCQLAIQQSRMSPFYPVATSAIVVRVGVAAVRGEEMMLSTGSKVRIAPFGNRTGHPYGKYPPYHRAVPNPSKPGQSLPGQGIGRHRPWEGGF